MNPAKALDSEFEEHVITGVRPSDGGWSIDMHGLGFFCPDRGIEPRVGSIARLYGGGLGLPVRGLDIDGQEVYYRTPEEDREYHRQQIERWHQKEREDFERRRDEYRGRVAELPKLMRDRFARFERNNPDFAWRFGFYELSCCEDALKIANRLGSAEELQAFRDLPWEEQCRMVPDLYEGHSGNSFGFACRLAWLWLEHREWVPLEHGALAVLVGCEEYGCPPVAQEANQ